MSVDTRTISPIVGRTGDWVNGVKKLKIDSLLHVNTAHNGGTAEDGDWKDQVEKERTSRFLTFWINRPWPTHSKCRPPEYDKRVARHRSSHEL